MPGKRLRHSAFTLVLGALLILAGCAPSPAPPAASPAPTSPPPKPTMAASPAPAKPTAAPAASPAASPAATPAAPAPVAGIPTVNPVAGKQFRVAFSVPALSFPFFQVMERDIKEEASRLNVTIITYDGQDSTTKQTADIEAAIAQRVDGIIISPKDVDALVPVLEQAAAANIPIVTIDRTINKQDILLGHVGADNVEGGRLQAQYVLDRLKDRAEKIRVVVLRGTPGSSPERDRSRGIFEVFDANKDRVEVVFDQTAQFRRAEAANVMEAAITATGGQIDAVVAENDEMIEGASQVIRAKGLEGKVLMVGFDAISETLDHIKQGTIHATIEQWPGRQASGALNMLYDFLANGKRPAQKINLIKPTLITQDNINETEQ